MFVLVVQCVDIYLSWLSSVLTDVCPGCSVCDICLSWLFSVLTDVCPGCSVC